MSNISLNVKAHIFRRVIPAIILAEKNSSEKKVQFAKKLLAARQSAANLNKIVRYKGNKITRAEKYQLLSARLSNATLLQSRQPPASSERMNLKERMDSLQDKLLPKKDKPDDRYLSPLINPLIFPPAFKDNLNRFSDIRAKARTAVGDQLNANKISIAGENIAIASQYPLPHQVENYLKMLVDYRTPVVAVLSSQSEIANAKNRMPAYFLGSNSYPCGIKTQSKLIAAISLGDGLEAKIYRLEIRGYDKGVAINVIHVDNWPDKTAVSGKATTILANEINQITAAGIKKYKEKGGRSIGNPDKLLPVVHCRAGVGRTGQIIAAMAMQKLPKGISLEKIVADMRHSRNGFMVQKEQQFDVLMELAEQQGRPLIGHRGA
ncbi:protein-tyrosine phosphatase family protein [Cedecea davisae]|uniref:protein-tyrosine phosphatase family protein n=1 Tax=Cedecea davisae TaxID=158484 RepID=UPI0024314ECA|nr:protein-tyrosine phosphatase family protein [Cedecea davisae]